MKFFKYFILIFSVLLLTPFVMSAASMSLISEGSQFEVGSEIVVNLVIEAEDDFINAAQGTIEFPAGTLEILEASKQGSVFNFWPEEPEINNTLGEVSFIGGTARGRTGESLQVLELRFLARKAGSADILLKEAVVTASDGRGTNVLSFTRDSSISIGGASSGVIENEAPVIPEVVVENPVKVTRTAVLSEDLPDEPVVKVPIYPNPEDWYNYFEDITVLWEVPDDITRVAVAFDQNPNTEPPIAEAELFTGKKLEAVNEEGIYYVHVQFRNNIGWGPVAHYRIAIDTTNPIPFVIEIDDPVSDNPSPLISISAQDAFSGFSHASVKVEGSDSFVSTSTSFNIPPQTPGKKNISVRVFDLAGNSISAVSDFEILPIPTPTIEFLSESISQGEVGFVSGRAVPNGSVEIREFNEEGLEISMITIETDGAGNWESVIGETLNRGKYSLTATARDFRMAYSLPSDPREFSIRAPVILSLGFVDLGWVEIVLIIILVVIAGGSFAGFEYYQEQTKRNAYNIIAKRDVEKMTNLLSKELKELEDWHAKQKYPNKSVKTEVEYRYKNLEQHLVKMKKYLGDMIGKTG